MSDVSLYGRLFRYRAREAREPLEDFLTEALADVLNRLPAPALSIVIEAMTGMPGLWAGPVATRRPRFATQVPCDGGFADLVMTLDGVPSLVVESKLHSGIRAHGDVDDPRDQLMTYGRWLERTRDGHEPAALVLLTHGTPPPAAFESGEGYGVASRAVFTWARLARCLRTVAAAVPDLAWGTMSFELAAFLEEKGMTIDTVTASDLAAARLFLPSWTRWKNTLTLLWGAVGDLREGMLSKTISNVEIDVDGGVIWSWCYAIAPFPHRSYLAFGIRFPDVSQWYSGKGLPEHPYLLLMIGAENSELPIDRISSLPGGWTNADGDLVTTLLLTDLPADTDLAATAMSSWGRSRLMEARDMMFAMRG